MPVKRFDYYAPASLDEALNIARDRGEGGRFLAGGTDLLVQMKEAGLHPPYVVDIRRLAELDGITEREGALRIGAATRMADIAAHPVVAARYGAVAEGAAVVGSVQTRNLATIGGNVCNAAPSADVSPGLVVHDAEALVLGAGGERRLRVEEMWLGPGRNALAPGEICLALELPAAPPRSASVYRRHTPRKEMDIAVVGVAVYLALDDRGAIASARIALGAVAPTIIRAPQAEASLAGQRPGDDTFARAAELAAQEARPIDDVRGTADFRRYLVGVMTHRLLAEAAGRAAR
jgi:carbon-monoxide dehydrogenase medium subunit